MQHYDRTSYEAILDVRYNIRLHQLSCRYYARLRWIAAVASLVAGSGALVGALQRMPFTLTACGIVVAVASAADIVGGWAEKGAKHQMWRVAFSDLLVRAPKMALDEIEESLARLDGTVDDEVEGLRLPAYNDNLRSNGRLDFTKAEPLRSRLMRMIA